MEQELFTTSEAAKLLGITAKTLRAWDVDGSLKPFNVNEEGHRQYSQQQIEEKTGKTLRQLRNPFLTLDKDKLEDMIAIAADPVLIDFHGLLGNTIREKYESLYVKLTELSYGLYRKNEFAPMNFIITSPEIASIFETVCVGFSPAFESKISGKQTMVYTGTVNSRWRLYHTYMLKPNQIIMGYVNEENEIVYKEDFIGYMVISN